MTVLSFYTHMDRADLALYEWNDIEDDYVPLVGDGVLLEYECGMQCDGEVHSFKVVSRHADYGGGESGWSLFVESWPEDALAEACQRVAARSVLTE